MYKVLFIFGTRPEVIKLAPIIKHLSKFHDELSNIICVTGQHRGMLKQMLDFFDITPDYNLDIMNENQSIFDITKRALNSLEIVFKKENPNLVIVQGDTTTTFIGALSAFYQKVPIAHIEAGLRTYDKYSPFPEEKNRNLTSVLADLHFAPTERAKDNLLKEGIDEMNIFVTGNTSIDALFMALDIIKFDKKYIRDNFIDDRDSKIILVTAHRRENFGRPLENICHALLDIIERNNNVEIVYPVHKNPNVRETVFSLLANKEKIHLIEPLDYGSFVYLMNQSFLILTDSGGIQEEAPSLNKPVLVMREKTERTEAVEAKTVKVVGTDREIIVDSTQMLLNDKEEYDRMANSVNPYGDGKAAERIVATIKEKFILERNKNFY